MVVYVFVWIEIISIQQPGTYICLYPSLLNSGIFDDEIDVHGFWNIIKGTYTNINKNEVYFFGLIVLYYLRLYWHQSVDHLDTFRWKKY